MQALRPAAAVQLGRRPAGYYDQSRPEVAALVPATCRRVLELGCGSGQLGQLLARRGHEVTGVELAPEVAEIARHRLHRVEVMDLEDAEWPFEPASFDAVVAADVLEHLVDPWAVLRRATALLRPGGVVVASLPNVQNIDVLWRLARGRWDYRERGILDRGHLRFFTLDGIRTLFDQAGLEVVSVDYRYRRSLVRRLLVWMTAGLARPFLCRQYLVVGRFPS